MRTDRHQRLRTKRLVCTPFAPFSRHLLLLLAFALHLVLLLLACLLAAFVSLPRALSTAFLLLLLNTKAS